MIVSNEDNSLSLLLFTHNLSEKDFHSSDFIAYRRLYILVSTLNKIYPLKRLTRNLRYNIMKKLQQYR